MCAVVNSNISQVFEGQNVVAGDTGGWTIEDIFSAGTVQVHCNGTWTIHASDQEAQMDVVFAVYPSGEGWIIKIV